jgi:DNA invertase Pin-like site-specific DNA recombinase
MRDLLRIVDLIQGKKAALRILGTDIDTGTPSGKLMRNLLGSFAEFERQIMLERQRAGIARAKSEGKFKGRKPTARAKSAAIMQLHGQGVAAAEIAHRLEISRASVFRVIEDARAEAESNGILKVAKTVGLGTSTVQKLKDEIVESRQAPRSSRVDGRRHIRRHAGA